MIQSKGIAKQIYYTKSVRVIYSQTVEIITESYTIAQLNKFSCLQKKNCLNFFRIFGRMACGFLLNMGNLGAVVLTESKFPWEQSFAIERFRPPIAT